MKEIRESILPYLLNYCSRMSKQLGITSNINLHDIMVALQSTPFTTEEVNKGEADEFLENYLKTHYEKEDVVKGEDISSHNNKDIDDVSKYFINITNTNSEIYKYVVNRVDGIDESKIKDFIDNYLKKNYTEEEILEGDANLYIDAFKHNNTLVNNSVKEKETVNKIKDKKKKKISKGKVIALIIALVSASTVLYELGTIINENKQDNEVNDYIMAYVNTESPKESNSLFNSNTSIINRNTTLRPPVEGESDPVVIYDQDGIVSDVMQFCENEPSVLDTVLINLYQNMNLDLATKLRNMDDIIIKLKREILTRMQNNPLNNNLQISFDELNESNNFIEYLNTKNLNDEYKTIIEEYKQKGYSNMSDSEKDTLKRVIDEYIKIKNDIYKEDIPTLENALYELGVEIDNGPIRG